MRLDVAFGSLSTDRHGDARHLMSASLRKRPSYCAATTRRDGGHKQSLGLLAGHSAIDARQGDDDLGKHAGLGFDVDPAAMLLDDDVMGHREAEPCPFPGRLGREERIEYLFPDVGRNAGAVVTNPDLYAVTKVLRRCRKGRLIAIATIQLLALSCGIEAVRDEVQKCSGDLLWEHVDLTGGRIKGPFQFDSEALILGARTVVRQIEALLDQVVGISQSMFA